MLFRLPDIKNEFRGKAIGRFMVSAANTLRLFSASFLGLVVNYILLHYKFPELLNLYVYCLTVAALFLLLCNWGGREFAIKELSMEGGRQKKVISILLHSRLFAVVLLTPVMVFSPMVQHPIVILVLVFTRSAISVFEAALIVEKRFLFSLFMELVVNGLFIVLLMVDGNSGNATFFLREWMLIELFRLVLYAWFFRGAISFKFVWQDVVDVFKRSYLFFAVALAGFCCSRADLYVLGLNLEARELSRYAIFINFIILCQVLFGAFFGAFVSNILRLAKQAFHNFKRRIFLAGLLFAVLGMFAAQVFSYVFFNCFLQTPFLLMVFINFLSYSSTFTSVYHFTRLNQQEVILKIIVVAGILNICASVFLIPKFGINGAFASNTFCALLTAIMFGIKARAVEVNA